MSFENPFVLPLSEYKRKLNPLGDYVRDGAKYLSLVTDTPIEQCRAFILENINGQREDFKVIDPVVNYFERQENGDREKKQIPLTKYIGNAIREERLISPSFTVYKNQKQKQSILVNYVESNIKKRGIAKKAMFKAKMEKDFVTQNIKNNEQRNAKLSNNAMSGAHVSASTPLYNKTSHSTLTSTCRNTSGYGNANNEKMLLGNRHYWSPFITLNNIMSIVTHSDYDTLKKIIDKYQLVYPSIQQTLEVISYSTDLYWKSSTEFDKIIRLVMQLSPLERAAFVYTGDLYHIRKFNEDFMRKFMGRLSSRIGIEHSDPKTVFSNVHEDYRNLACQICENETKGIKHEDLHKHTKEYAIVASTIENILNTITEHSDFIKAFLTTTNVPASVAYFPDSIRRSALTSDTDSTIFTVENWVEWFFGYIKFGPEANGFSATLIFLASQVITHVLALMSANFGVDEKRRHQNAMKNEYKFDIFVPTQVSKHYYALIGCQEGNIFKEYDMEIKGVHLKSSNAPKEIMQGAKQMMHDLMMTVIDGKKIKILEVFKTIADIERDIFNSIAKGDTNFFRLGQIKPAKSYKKSEEESPYSHYLFWNEVFGPKYGFAQEPPYGAIKVSVDLLSPTDIAIWVKSITDLDLAYRLQDWITRNQKTRITTLYLPHSIIQVKGIPEEILCKIDSKKIVLDAVKVYYIILETLGFYLLGDKKIQLVSDSY